MLRCPLLKKSSTFYKKGTSWTTCPKGQHVVTSSRRWTNSRFLCHTTRKITEKWEKNLQMNASSPYLEQHPYDPHGQVFRTWLFPSFHQINPSRDSAPLQTVQSLLMGLTSGPCRPCGFPSTQVSVAQTIITRWDSYKEIDQMATIHHFETILGNGQGENTAVWVYDIIKRDFSSVNLVLSFA